LLYSPLSPVLVSPLIEPITFWSEIYLFGLLDQLS